MAAESEERQLLALAGSWQAADVIVDQYSGLAHKPIVGPGSQTAAFSLAPSWVSSMHVRRLNAYRVLSGYMANIARAYLPSQTTQNDRAEHREYGDPSVIVDALVTAVLGDGIEFVVEGADDEPEEPDAPEEPTAPDPAAGPEAQAQFEKDRADFDKKQAKYLDEKAKFDERMPLFERAQKQQEYDDQWVEDEKLIQAIEETEQDAVALGDGVYLLAWSNEKKRVRVRLYDPGFYFPVLDDSDDFPNRVHLAWQYEDTTDKKMYVRRITFERRKLDAPRSYPWNQSSDWATYMTDARWRFDDLGDRSVDDFSPNRAIYSRNADDEELRDFFLGIDFLPILHVPNTASRKQHFGQSALVRVAQIFDDLADNDTDLNALGALVAAPPIAVGGHAGPSDGTITTYGPGRVFFVGDGRMDILDTSKAPDALIKIQNALLDRLSVNVPIPEVVLGRVSPSDVPSGFSMLVGFGPFKTFVGKMRLVRAEKYPLMFKMMHRLAQVGGVLPEGPDIPVQVRFGAFLPTDLNGITTMVKELLTGHALSRKTALRWLSDAGAPLDDDLAAELERIEREDFEGARTIADATGDEGAAAEYLGIEIEQPAAVTRGAVVPPGGGPVPAPTPAGPPGAPPGAPGQPGTTPAPGGGGPPGGGR